MNVQYVLDTERPGDINLVRFELNNLLREMKLGKRETGSIVLSKDEATTLMNDIDRSWARGCSD